MRLIEKFNNFLHEEHQQKMKSDLDQSVSMLYDISRIYSRLTLELQKSYPLINEYYKQLQNLKQCYEHQPDWDARERLNRNKILWREMIDSELSLMHSDAQADLDSYNQAREVSPHLENLQTNYKPFFDDITNKINQYKQKVEGLVETVLETDYQQLEGSCVEFIETCLKQIREILNELNDWQQSFENCNVEFGEKYQHEKDLDYPYYLEIQQQIYDKLLNESLIVLCAKGDLTTIKNKWDELQEELNFCYGWTEYDEYGHDKGSERVYPLHVACQERQLEVVRFLIKMGADPSLEDSQLFWDAEARQFRGHRAYDYLIYDADKTLYSNYLLKQRRLNDLDKNSLIVLCNRGDLTTIQKNWCNLKKELNRTEYGYYPLHVACDEGYTEIVKFLLKQGANPELRDGNNCQANDYLDVDNGQYIVKANDDQTSSSWCAKLFCCFLNHPVQTSNRPSTSAGRRRMIDSDSSLPIYASSESGSSQRDAPRHSQPGLPTWAWPAPDTYEQNTAEDQQLTANEEDNDPTPRYDPGPRPVSTEAQQPIPEEETYSEYLANSVWSRDIRLDPGNGVSVGYSENGPLTF